MAKLLGKIKMKSNEEITGLITIRNYLFAALNDSAVFDRQTYNYISNIKVLIDKKIMSLLMDEEFKNYIDYGNVKKALKEVTDLNNIKAGLVNGEKQKAVVINEEGRPIIKTKT
jgi:hypothetical protein